MESSISLGVPARRPRMAPLAGVGIFLLLALVGLTWAKWSPYAHKAAHLWGTHAWSGKDVLAKAGPPGSPPSLAGAWKFTVAYFKAVWMALVAALVISAAVQSLVPQRWLLRMMAPRRGARASLAGGLLALPSLMCTCCTAPVTVGLRRQGVPRAAALAYWVGNPVLNPAVLVFLALVAPWQWLLTRILVGAVLVFAATLVVARLAGEPEAEVALDEVPEFRLAAAPLGFLRALGRLSVTLLPEYLVVVLLLGLFRGWLFPFDGTLAHWAIPATLLAAGLGTLLVIPTAGEIPVVQGLAAAGAGAGVVGALLITLPAISLVSMAMVARSLSPRVTAAMALAVMLCGVLGGALLLVLRL